MAITTIQELANKAATDTAFQARLQENPVGTLQEVASNVGVPNTAVYIIVVTALSLTILIALVGAILLAWHVKDGKPVETPAIITALGSAAVGALAGLLTPIPRAK